MLVVVLQWLFLHWENLIMLLPQFPLTFHQTQSEMPYFIDIDLYYSCGDSDSLCNHFRDVLWEDILKLSASAAASEFCEWVQVETGVYIPCCEY